MKMLSQLNRESLLTQTHKLVAEEKRIELELLDHLREIERRMLHLEMGYSSLYEFAVKHLKLSEASAYRRIETMRVVREIPEVKVHLESGTLTLTNVAAAETFFKAEKKQGRMRSVAEKREVLSMLEGLSKRECERKLLEISPQALPREKERALTVELTELKLVVDAETLSLLQKLKDALPGAATREVLKHALRVAVNAKEKTRTPRQPVAPPAGRESLSPAGEIKVRESGKFAEDSTTTVISSHAVATSLAETRRLVYARAQGRCEFVAKNGRRCSSSHSLEVDHIQPRALNGSNSSENLRLLCRSHNAFAAVRIFGTRSMQRYIPSLGAST